jgi:mRNA-decapping enzyme subunit 2
MEEFQSFERICFQLELAHWFFEDNYRTSDPLLPSFTLKDFFSIMFQHCPLLQPYANQVDEIMTNFIDYKTRVPAYGAVLLNPSLKKCLLVKGCGFRPCWGFPRGKVNQNESEIECAIREVSEEIGFNLNGLISESDYIEQKVRDQVIKLFIVPFIPEDTEFHPRTKNEIGGIEWHEISDIPITYTELKDRGKNAINYYNAIPFLPKLKKWIDRKKQQMKKQPQNPRPIQTSSRISSPLSGEGLQCFSPVKHSAKRTSQILSNMDDHLKYIKNHPFNTADDDDIIIASEHQKINPLLTFRLSTDRLLECLSHV